MDVQSHVELTRLQCEHLRTLLDRVVGELTTIGQALATEEKSPSALMAPALNRVVKQREHLALETERLQSFVHSLVSQSPASKPRTTDTKLK